MGWLIGFFDLATDWCDDYSWAVIVTDIILDDKNRSEPVLFTSNDGTQVSEENIAPMDFFDNHNDTSVLVVSL